ncbi:MAG TPA: hypothetical protein VJ718_11490 [Candidatus Binataceae bacterium]|nr:hypothetical protein [Candidatus Binataceae bacterium]
MRFDRRAPIAAIFASAALLITAAPGHCFSITTLLGNGSEDRNLDTFKLIHVADLKALMGDSNSGLRLYDANSSTTREKYGVISGAYLLDSDDHYKFSALPPDKSATLVFYCANTH